jgi:hypothetical protein
MGQEVEHSRACVHVPLCLCVSSVHLYEVYVPMPLYVLHVCMPVCAVCAWGSVRVCVRGIRVHL